MASGIEDAGWKLVYTDQPNEYEKLISKRCHGDIGAAFDIGLIVGKDGEITDVHWNGFKAGMGSGERWSR